jgi:hypothetical protein
MRKIGFGFSTPKKWKLGSQMIRWYEGTKYSHIFMVMYPSPKSKLPFKKVFQASHGDVNCLSYEVFEEQNHIFHFYEIDVSDVDYYRAAQWLWSQLQKPYSISQLTKIGFNISIKKESSDSSYICTELAGKLLANILDYEIHRNLDYIGLKQIKEILDKIKGRKK